MLNITISKQQIERIASLVEAASCGETITQEQAAEYSILLEYVWNIMEALQ